MLRISQLLTLTMLNLLNRIIHLAFLAHSIIIFTDIKMKTWSANSIVLGQALLHGCVDWPCCMLVAKTNHVWCWQDKG